MWFANAGLADAEVTLVRLDEGLAIVGGARAWNLRQLSPPASIEVKVSPSDDSGVLSASTPRCGVLSFPEEGGSGETFCIASGALE